jgi:hypothetical protein
MKKTMIVGLRAEMSVQEIARWAGISRAHAHRLLAGEVRRPSYDTVMRLQNVQRRSSLRPKAETALKAMRVRVHARLWPTPGSRCSALLETRQPSQPFPALARGSNGTSSPLGGRLLANRAASASSSSQAFSRQRGPKSRCSAKITPVGRPRLTGWRRLSSIDPAAPGRPSPRELVANIVSHSCCGYWV